MQHAMGGKGTTYSTEQIQKEARRLLWDHFGLIVNPDDPTATNTWWATANDQVHWVAQTHRWIGPPPPLAETPKVNPPINATGDNAGANDF
jgi:poly(3-hydroxyalkanoate) synthetase